jgi:hypothetical protein
LIVNRRFLRATSILPLDLALVAAAGIAVAILVTGGGVFHVGGVRISSLGARNPLIATFALLALRLTLAAREPFLFVAAARPDAIAPLAARTTRAFGDWLSALPPERVRHVLMALLGASFVVKALNIFYYYGFSYGDDVEIHVMTFSQLLHRDLGVWTLRSPFYPLVFIYPLQRALREAGVRDPFVLIAAGRLVVAAFSLLNLWLVFKIGVRLFRSVPVAVLAVFFLSVARLQVRLGSSEEPRTVSATFLLVCFWCLIAYQGALGSAVAGVALGIAASLRFSEAIFLVPLCLTLGHERRFRSLAIAALTAAATCLLILGPGDRLYWPSTFFSLRNIVDFTVVKGLSSRGYEPVWQYLLLAPLATDVLFIGLFLYSFRSAGSKLLVWSIVPLVLLSAFRHKEERYLLPLLPFWALCVAAGFWRVLGYSARQTAGARCYLALYLFTGVTLSEIDGWRFRRSEDAVDVARELSRRPDVRDVAMEEATTVTGANLYLAEKATVVNIDSRRSSEPGYLRTVLDRPEAQYVVLSERALRLEGCRELLRAAGYLEVSTPTHYGIFRATHASRVD